MLSGLRSGAQTSRLNPRTAAVIARHRPVARIARVTARSLRCNRGCRLTAREVERLIASVKIGPKAASLSSSGTPRQGPTRSFALRRKQSDFITFAQEGRARPQAPRAGPVAASQRGRAAHSVASVANCRRAGGNRRSAPVKLEKRPPVAQSSSCTVWQRHFHPFSSCFAANVAGGDEPQSGDAAACVAQLPGDLADRL